MQQPESSVCRSVIGQNQSVALQQLRLQLADHRLQSVMAVGATINVSEHAIVRRKDCPMYTRSYHREELWSCAVDGRSFTQSGSNSRPLRCMWHDA
eukprot:SAG31_NODE_6797_length_1884_cov_1.099720_4_plen_95_part_01